MEREKGWGSGEAEIETRAAFGSVKEAVALFGEKFLAGEINGTRLKEIRRKETNTPPSPQSGLRSLTLKLEQTKQTLTRTLELNTILSNRNKALTQELEHERKEMQRHMIMRSCRPDNPEIEELKFVEQDFEQARSKHVEQDVLATDELEKKRLVTFASSPLLTRVMSNVEDGEVRKKEEKETDYSVKKTKIKKGFGWFRGWFRTSRGGA